MVQARADAYLPGYKEKCEDNIKDWLTFNSQLTRIFNLAATWEAVILIDEEDLKPRKVLLMAHVYSR